MVRKPALRSIVESLEHRRLLSAVVLAGTTNYPVGGYPVGIAAGDVTGDGNVDLVTANSNDSTLSILAGVGDGTFAAQYTIPTDVPPADVTVADVNNDGIPDLIASGNGSGSAGIVTVFKGTGNGHFAAGQDYPVGEGVWQVVTADVNHDGYPDIIAANSDTNNVSVLLNLENGNFGAAASFPVGTEPQSVAVGDVNGDGFPDIVTANRADNDVSVLLGDGNGSFGSPTFFDVGTDPWSVTIDDFNLDGKPDIATANYLSDSVSVLFGNGKGSFAAAKNYPAGLNPQYITSADLNSDGVPDLIVGNGDADVVTTLLNKGAGTFAAPQSFATGHLAFAVVAADLNQDGVPDIAAVDYRDFAVRVLINFPVARAPRPITPNNRATGVSLKPTLSWTSVPTGRYRVIIATDPSSLPTEPYPATGVASAADDDTAYSNSFQIHTQLRPGTKYYWEVQGNNDDLVGYWSKVSSFTTAPDTAPVVAKIANRTITAGTTITATGSFADPDSFDRWTGLIDWGDGTAKRSLSLQSNKRFALTHVYSKAGTFIAKATITDRYGKGTTRAFTISVIK